MENLKKDNNKISIQSLTIISLFVAMTYVATWLINIRLPLIGSGGLIHLGNVPLFIGAMLFGKKTGMFAGAIGMGLFDLMSGWTAWAPFTFIIVGAMGFVVGWFAERKPISNPTTNAIASLLIALIIKLVGYYFAEVILYGNWLAPFGSILGNVLQVGTAAIITMATVPLLKKALGRNLERLHV